jgi:hypothetical protein
MRSTPAASTHGSLADAHAAPCVRLITMSRSLVLKAKPLSRSRPVVAQPASDLLLLLSRLGPVAGAIRLLDRELSSSPILVRLPAVEPTVTTSCHMGYAGFWEDPAGAIVTPRQVGCDHPRQARGPPGGQGWPGRHLVHQCYRAGSVATVGTRPQPVTLKLNLPRASLKRVIGRPRHSFLHSGFFTSSCHYVLL